MNWNLLIEKSQKGDRAALSELINFAHKHLFIYCLHLTKNRQLAEDLTHDALLKALATLKQLREPEAFMGWVKTIARSQYLDFVKSAAQKKTHIGVDDLDREDGFSQDPSTSPEQIQAMRVLQKLSEEDRSILILIDIQECSYQEAAEVLKIPEGTVKSRLSRARDKFSAIFDGTKSDPQSSQLKERLR